MTRSPSYESRSRSLPRRNSAKFQGRMQLAARLYIGGISSRVSDRELRDHFDRYGPIVQTLIKEGFGFVEYESKKDAEYAVEKTHGTEFQGRRITVEFARQPGRRFRGSPPPRRRYSCSRSRGYARRHSHSRERGSYRRKKRSYSRSRSPYYRRRRSPSPRGVRGRKGDFRIRVENMSSATSWQDLKDFARGAGSSVTFTKCWTDDGKNFGLIEYMDERDYDAALDNLDGSRLDGNKVRMVPEGENKKRQCSHSQSRSRSSSHRKSRSESLQKSQSSRKDSQSSI